MELYRSDRTPICTSGEAPVETSFWRASQFNQNFRRDMSMPYGRFLRGDDDETGQGPIAAKAYQDIDADVNDANQQDDSIGNGIFDWPGAKPVQSAGSGVFEGHFAEPGYLYRERLAKPGTTVDEQSGLQVVHMPAGGAWPQDMRDSYLSFDNETPRHYGTPPTNARPIPPKRSLVPMKQTVRAPMDQSSAISGFGAYSGCGCGMYGCAGCSGVGGDEKEPASMGQIVLAGAIAGVAVGLLWATLKAGPKTSKRAY